MEQLSDERRGDDVIVYGVFDDNLTVRFVGASRRDAFPFRAAMIRRGKSSHYRPTALDLWVRGVRASGGRVMVLEIFTRSARELGLSGKEGRRRAVDNLILNHIATLKPDVQANLLNGRVNRQLDSSLLVAGRLSGAKRNSQAASHDRRLYGGVVYGLYHNGKLIYVGTSAGSKKDVMASLLQGRYNSFTKSRVIQYVCGLADDKRLNELLIRKIAVYEAGKKREAKAGVIRSLGESEVAGLLNERISGYLDT